MLYGQIYCTAMWSSLWSTFAKCFIGHLWRKKSINNYSRCKYVRYVTIVFVNSDSEKVSSSLFMKSSSLHLAILFTKETEVGNQISFLNVPIKRIDKIKYHVGIQKTFFHGSISKLIVVRGKN